MSHLNVYIMNKVRKLLLVCGCFLGSMSLSAEVTSGSDFEILMQKIRQDFSKNPSIDEALSFYREGAFTDVDYESIQRTDWPPLVHLQRVSDFVFAYTNPENPYYADGRLFDKIQAGLELWHERNPCVLTGGIIRLPSRRNSVFCLFRCVLVKGRFRKYWRQRSCNVCGRTADILPDGLEPTGRILLYIGFIELAFRRMMLT